MSYNLKITVYNNRDYEQGFTLKDPDGDPYNLTGCKLIFSIWNEDSTITSHTSGTSNNKCIFISDTPTDGGITLALPFTVLRLIKAGNYNHDLVLLTAAGKRDGIWAGTMTVKKGGS